MHEKEKIFIIGMEVYLKEYGMLFENEMDGIPNSVARRMDSFSLLVAHTVKNAMKDAGIECFQQKRCGAVFNTYWGPLESTELFFRSLISDGAENVPPSLFPSLVTNASLGKVCKMFQILDATTFLIATAPMEYALSLMKERNIEHMLILECDQLYETNVSACIAEQILEDVNYKFINSNLKVVGGCGAFVLQRFSEPINGNIEQYVEVIASESIYAPMVINQLSISEVTKRFSTVIRRALQESQIDLANVASIISFSNNSSAFEEIDEIVFSEIFGDVLANIEIIKPKAMVGECFAEGMTIALKAGIEAYSKKQFIGKVIICCSYTLGSNINVTIIKK